MDWYAEDGRGVKKHLMMMRRVHNFALRWITGAFRGTPSGALEMIAHIPPLEIWCNLSIYGMMACIHTLPDSHLLKIAWQGSLVKLAYKRIRPKRHPRNLPSNNPNERLRTAKDTVREQFDVYHEANKPGCRVEDVYGACIIRGKMDAPKKTSDDFKQWVVEYKE